MKIGMFDSGIGGVTVLKEALAQLPQLDYIYYSDNLNVPYGTKTKEAVLGYVHNVMDFMMSQQVDAVVIACNTATSIVIKELRETYDIPIIGMEPAVKLALDSEKQGRILVTATPLTLKEEKFRKLVASIDGSARVDSLALPELVAFAEQFIFDETVLVHYFKEKLKDYDLKDYSGFVLGCTHFVYFKKALEKILPKHIHLYDGNEGTIRHLRETIKVQIEQVDPQHRGKVDFYYSAEKDEHNTLLNKYLEVL